MILSQRGFQIPGISQSVVTVKPVSQSVMHQSGRSPKVSVVSVITSVMSVKVISQSSSLMVSQSVMSVKVISQSSSLMVSQSVMSVKVISQNVVSSWLRT